MQAALTFLRNILIDERGIGLLHGPESTGKSQLIGQFVEELRPVVAIAVIDGTQLKPPELLSGIIEQFGYNVDLNSIDELLNMLRVIIVQQTRSHRAPVLVVQNINQMYPSTLCVLCKLASQMAHRRFALRIILVGDRPFRRILESPSMRPIADRLIGNFELKPLPEPESPRLVVTLNGETLQEVNLANSRALIGRSELSDIICEGEFVSRQHALLIRDQDAVVLIDLNSRNGTFVNSKRISSKVLRDSDIIMVGDHRIKLVYKSARGVADTGKLDIADTATMKSIADARQAKINESPELAVIDQKKA